jgi:hypothetical protein
VKILHFLTSKTRELDYISYGHFHLQGISGNLNISFPFRMVQSLGFIMPCFLAQPLYLAEL